LVLRKPIENGGLRVVLIILVCLAGVIRKTGLSETTLIPDDPSRVVGLWAKEICESIDN
jgi:hypothetical protein